MLPSSRFLSQALKSKSIVRQRAHFSRSFSTAAPLTEPLAGFEAKEGSSSPYELKSSELSNGIKVVTYGAANENTMMTSLAVTAHNGTRFETAATAGATFVAEQLAFGSTQLRSALRVTREWEMLPAQFHVTAARESLSYAADVPRSRVTEALPLLADTLQPSLASYEVRDVIPAAEHAAATALQDPVTWLLDHLHGAAFANVSLGRSLYPLSLSHVTPHLRDFFQQHLVGSRLTLVATGGLNHEELVQQIEESFGHFPRGTPVTAPASTYVGGQFYSTSASPSYFALGLEGVRWTDADLPALLVLTQLCGEGRQSSRGLGWGTTSQAQSWIGQQPGLHALRALHIPYSDTGLWALLGRAESGQGRVALETVVKGLRGLASGAQPAEAVQRAVKQTQFALAAVESRATLRESIVAAVAGGVAEKGVPSVLSKTVASVTPADVQRVAQKLVSKPLTVVAAGDVSGLPSVAALQSQLRS